MIEKLQWGRQLAILRTMRGMTQAQVAEKMGVGATRVGIIEHQSNMRLSTLIRYVTAVNGKISITAVFKDQAIDLLTGETKENS